MGSHLQAEPSVDIWELNLPKTSVFTGIERIFSVWFLELTLGVVGEFWLILGFLTKGDKDPHPAIPRGVKETKQGQGGGELISGFAQVSPNCLCIHFLLCTSRAVPPTSHSQLINSC